MSEWVKIYKKSNERQVIKLEIILKYVMLIISYS